MRRLKFLWIFVRLKILGWSKIFFNHCRAGSFLFYTKEQTFFFHFASHFATLLLSGRERPSNFSQCFPAPATFTGLHKLLITRLLNCGNRNNSLQHTKIPEIFKKKWNNAILRLLWFFFININCTYAMFDFIDRDNTIYRKIFSMTVFHRTEEKDLIKYSHQRTRLERNFINHWIESRGFLT